MQGAGADDIESLGTNSETGDRVRVRLVSVEP
jgi:hypothetical protein